MYTGELAALGTACLWSVGSLFFDAAGRRIGPLSVNKVRIPFAAVLLSLALLATTGRLVPASVPLERLGWLALSGFVGLVLGDACLFTSLVILGPRRATLLMVAAPPIATLIAWPVLGEALGLCSILGITVTIAGVVWVSSEKRGKSAVLRTGSLMAGALWGLGGAAGQGIGLVLAKLGMGNQVTALEGTFCRMASAAVLIWAFELVSGKVPSTVSALRDRRGVLFALAGACVGPFLGVWLSLVSVQRIEAGVAATLMAIVPVLVIPLEVIIHCEHLTPRAVVGACIAVAGVAILFLK